MTRLNSVLVAVLLIVGCASPLDGHEFLVMRIVEDGVVRAPAAGRQLSISFDHRRAVARACYGTGGGYDTSGGVFRWREEPHPLTAMGCHAEAHAQERWLTDFLSTQPTLLVQGDALVLDSGTTRVELLRALPQRGRDGEWRLVPAGGLSGSAPP